MAASAAAAAPGDAATQPAAAVVVDSRLKYLLSEAEVDESIQERLFSAGVNKLFKYRGLGETREEVKTALRTHFGLDTAFN